MYMANIKIIGADKRRIQKIIFVTLGTKKHLWVLIGITANTRMFIFFYF